MSMPTRISLATAGDVLAAIPYLLGFHPSDSVAFIALRDHTVFVTARLDLQQNKPLPRGGVQDLVRRLTNDGITAIILVGYGAAAAVTPMIDAVREACHRYDIEVPEVLRVTGERYWSYLCSSDACCPTDGRPLPDAVTAIAAEFVAAGKIALDSRAALASSLGSIDDLETITTLIAAIRLVPESRAQAEALLQQYTSGSSGFPDIAETALILNWLRHDDRLVAAAIDRVDETDPAAQIELWIWLIRHAPAGYSADPASLLSYAAWRAGNGALARIAGARALADAPSRKLAHLVTEIADVDPRSAAAPPPAAFRFAAHTRA